MNEWAYCQPYNNQNKYKMPSLNNDLNNLEKSY